MKNMKVIVLSLILVTSPAYSIFGDGGAGYSQLPYIIKILTENIKRYQQLKMMINNAKDHKNYLKLINSGLENSIGLLQTLPVKDEELLAELKTFKQSYNSILKFYGQIPKSKESVLQLLHDQTYEFLNGCVSLLRNF